jgi:cation diffusion facilitator CzcD-associated flavoprotein CzcO
MVAVVVGAGLSGLAAARHLDYYVNPVGYVYGADGARVA